MRELRAMGIELSWWNPTSVNSVLLRDGKPRRAVGGSFALMRWLAGDGAKGSGKPFRMKTPATAASTAPRMVHSNVTGMKAGHEL